MSAAAERLPRRPLPIDRSAPRPTDLLLAYAVVGVAYLLAAALVAAVGGQLGWGPTRWLALHLALLGGVSQLVVGVSQFFVTAFLATVPPARRSLAFQLACWNAGTVAVAAGVAGDLDALTVAGAVALLVALAGYALALRRLRATSLRRAPWASRWYDAGAVALAAGVVVGALLASGVAWHAGSLLGAHLALNLGGWLGAAIVGTLHSFFPSLTQTRLRFPRLQPVAFAGWTAGVAALATGYGFDIWALTVAGWAALALAAVALAANLAASARAAEAPLSLPARLVGLGQGFLLAGLAVALAAALGDGTATSPGGAERAALAVLLLAGWVGLTVVGSLLHLLGVVLAVRDLGRRPPAVGRLRVWALPLLAGVAVAALAVARLAGIEPLVVPAALALTAVYLLLAASVVRLAGAAIRLGPRAQPR